MFDGFRYVVVGSGFTGAVLAERIAEVLAEPVLVLERRSHTGGNAYSSIDPETGIECHRYGSHIFHTRHAQVWQYVRRFGEFSSYRHHVLTEHGGRVYSMPISLDTINQFYGISLKPFEAQAFIQQEAARAGIREPKNLEEKAVSLIGKPLYEAFIKGYTTKQWNRDPKDLPASIITRLPVRSSYNTEYFNDQYQGIPLDGYGVLLANMLGHPRIAVRLETECTADMLTRKGVCVLYTGMIDQFFGYSLGGLDWRSLHFESEVAKVQDYQGVSVMNSADMTVPYTRIHEFKHYHPEREDVFASQKTLICREYPQDFSRGLEPYYPVNDEKNQKLYSEYAALSQTLADVHFCGRLGGYAYCDMDIAVKNALAFFVGTLRGGKL